LRFEDPQATISDMPDLELVSRVAATTGLTRAEAERVVDDVVAYFDESTEDYVRRRHHALKEHGLKNPEIWSQISQELSHRVVSAPELSERQLRRIVYG
jgi:hypothetical protein